jgi:hypothetical protein
MKVTFRPIGNDWHGERSGWGVRRRTPFKAGWAQTQQQLDRELAALGASEVIFQLDMAERDIRIDGYPRANARPSTPAVIISFKSRHGWLRYQCDTFEGGAEGWQDNVRAVALGLEALRQVERYGITKRGEQYTGWKALPATTLGKKEAEEFIRLTIAPVELDFATLDLTRAYRLAARKLHPDVGGSPESWEQLQMAKQVLGI